jgi:hypothetical protein
MTLPLTLHSHIKAGSIFGTLFKYYYMVRGQGKHLLVPIKKTLFNGRFQIKNIK